MCITPNSFVQLLFFFNIFSVLNRRVKAAPACSSSVEARLVQWLQSGVHDIEVHSMALYPVALASLPRESLPVNANSGTTTVYTLKRLAEVANVCEAGRVQDVRRLELLEPNNRLQTAAFQAIANACAAVRMASLTLADYRIECRVKAAARRVAGGNATTTLVSTSNNERTPRAKYGLLEVFSTPTLYRCLRCIRLLASEFNRKVVSS